jgi:hypothetical protein
MVMGITLISEVPEPQENTTEHGLYTNLSKVINITYTGMYGSILIIIVAIIIVAVGAMAGKGW